MSSEALFEQILVPIDFSPCSREALVMAARLAESQGASLTLVHVAPLAIATPPTGLFAEGLMDTLQEVQDQACQGALETLSRWALEVVPESVSTRLRVRSGPAGMAILELLDQGGIDLVVMGTHGRTGLPRLLMGSVAERITRLSPVPVLVARAKAAA